MAEVMAAQYVEPAEVQHVEPEVLLDAGLQQHHHHTTTTTAVTADDMPEKSFYLDNGQGETDEWSISGANKELLQDLDVKLVDSDIGKALNAFINAQDDEIKPTHDASTSTEREVQVTDSAEDEYEEEEIELEFERAIKKLDAHTTMHCPKCQTQVTRVILRRRRKIAPKPKPLNLLGCLSCFGVFIPSGKHHYNMFGLFGTDQSPKPQATPSLGETIPPPPATTTPLVIPSKNGNVVIQDKGGCFGLFGIFANKYDNESVKKPLLESEAVPSGSPSQPTQKKPLLESEAVPSGSPSQPTQVEQDQPQYSKPKDEAATGSSSNQKGKHVVGIPPPGVIKPGDFRLDIPDELVVSTIGASLLGKPSGEPSEGTEGSRDGAPLLGEQTNLPERHAPQPIDQEPKSIEIVKSIVYGGLMETITSLSIVASAAASEATTLNILALGLANLVGGIFIIGHYLWDLKDEHRVNPGANKYKELLGRRENFPIHATLAILSFILFGLVSPVTYGFAFRESDNKDYKILAVAAAALLCVVLLAIGQAYAQRTPKFHLYLKTITYYVSTAFAVSGVSYAAGHLAKKFIDELGLFDTSSPAGLSFPGMNSMNSPILASY